MTADETLHVIVHGRVQGVGFRWFTQRTARHLGLTGWVRNLPAGTVEVYAVGPVDALDRLRDALHRGPAGASVEAVHVASAAAPIPMRPGHFDVRHD
ncbi:MAG: acylphosphatase [Gemmatimonadaceae bacterium]|jgi:acylphosphatase|nr:acylphosphatase [Gemmatimonadaceae bacterium]